MGSGSEENEAMQGLTAPGPPIWQRAVHTLCCETGRGSWIRFTRGMLPNQNTEKTNKIYSKNACFF